MPIRIVLVYGEFEASGAARPGHSGLQHMWLADSAPPYLMKTRGCARRPGEAVGDDEPT